MRSETIRQVATSYGREWPRLNSSIKWRDSRRWI